ncbi:hypothetical protein F4678DRAFT_336142 [Xylaria arbuscula]|nr:hypothetical protein F4678DRAFT_336142 [Xylaria arbuscula]
MVGRALFTPAPIYTISVVAFDDCDSKSALSIYRGISPRTPASQDSSATTVLPPLFSFQVYVTYNVDLTEERENLARRLFEYALEDFYDDDLVRLDIYFHPGASNADILRHYVTEKRAVNSYATEGSLFRRFAIVVASDQWEQHGVTLLYHDPPADYLHSSESERAVIFGDDIAHEITDEGLLLVQQPIRDESIGMSLSGGLHMFACGTADYDNYEETYREAIKEGRTEW